MPIGVKTWNSVIGQGGKSLLYSFEQPTEPAISGAQDCFVRNGDSLSLKDIEQPAKVADNRPPMSSTRSRFFA